MFESCLPDLKKDIPSDSNLTNNLICKVLFFSACQIFSKKSEIPVSKSVSIYRHGFCTHRIAGNYLYFI